MIEYITVALLFSNFFAGLVVVRETRKHDCDQNRNLIVAMIVYIWFSCVISIGLNMQ